ncbi:MAG: type II toxin-antitoxin system HicB family antitoxin [Nitrospirae bacterium]|nr:type II toxin-antitoxin system HicB family antitoxin [Candidatus Manganitrophaceae bacterium]
MKVKVVLEEREDGGFKVFVPSLPDCICDGKNQDEAFEKVQSAILRYYGIEAIYHRNE